MPIYVVEAVRTFRLKYIVECENSMDALDTVAMEEAEEFSQMFLGEQIICAKEITYEEFERMNDALHKYGDGTEWQPETGSPWIKDRIITKVKYGKNS